MVLYVLVGAAFAAEGDVLGWVLDGARPVPDATLIAERDGARIELVTDPSGGFHSSLADGVWTLVVTLPDGRSQTFSLTTVADRSTEAVLPFDPAPPAEATPRARLTGTVLDDQGLGIPRAYVHAVGGGDAVTDMDGRYALDAPIGTVEVAILRAGFVPLARSVQVDAEGAALDVSLALEASGDELTVTAEVAPGGTVELLRERKEASAVTDVVGSEQMSRAGDTNAASALTRVNGVTIVGGRYVFVRGLGDRYSATQLDGATLPSPEPEKRVVPLDLFPTALLDAVVIQKTFSPEMPAEFGGGVVQIRTRRIPEEPVLSIGVSGGWASGTTLAEADVAPAGDTDWIGFGTASRALPASIASAEAPLKVGGIFSDGGYTAEEIEAFGEALPDRWSPERRVLPPDLGLTASAGRRWAFGALEFGALGGVVYSNAWDVDDGWQATYSTGSEGLEEKRRTTFSETVNRVRLGGMASLALAWGEGGELASTTLLARNSAATALTYDADDPTGSNDSRTTRIQWEEQQLFYEQATLAVPLGPVRLDARYALALANQAEPDRREHTYLATDEGYVLAQRGSWNDIQYGLLADTSHDGGLSATWTIPREAGDTRLAVGGQVVARTRDAERRRFNFQFQGSEGIDLAAPIEDVIVPENIGPEEEGDAGYLELEENTTSTDDYRAEQRLYAAYALGDVPWTNRVRTLVGARVESSEQTVQTFERTEDGTPAIVGALATTDVLPAATLTFGIGPAEVPDGMQIRAGYGRTLSRPELRELSEVAYYDYRSGRLLYGNPELDRATIENVDLRWEWYPTAGESVSAGGFFKYFDHPIESIVAVSAVSGSVGTFANATSATNLGGEVDVRKRLDFLHRALYDLYLSGNVAVIHSRVDLSDTEGNQTSSERPLQGQSPWVVNAQLSYENPDLRTNIAALYNVYGPRITSVGTSGIPDTYEEPVHRVDLVVTQGIGPHWQVRVKGSNLLDWPSRETTGDRVSEETRDGWSAGLGVTWTPL